MGKHRKTIAISSILMMLVVIAISAILFRNNPGRTQMPFSDLSADDITSISVFAIPPNETVFIYDIEQIEIIVGVLKTVVIYQKSNEWKGMAGQMVTFIINKSTGESVEVSAYNPHLIIDGQGYETDYQPCENLNRVANTLLNTRFGGQPIE